MIRPTTTTASPHLPVPVVVLDRAAMSRRAGATLAEIIVDATPNLPQAQRAALRVVLVRDAGADVVPAALWRRVRPKPGTHVVIRSVPTGNSFRSILMIVVAIAASFLAPILGGALAGTLGLSAATWTTIATVGITAIGMLLINALIPPRRPDDREYGGYSLSGWRNSSNPDGPVPAPFGRLRMAPYYAAPPYTEIVGDLQYIRAVFVWGYGPLALSDFRFGETAITEYDEVEIEHRHGYPDDPQLTLYTEQVIEEGLSVDLTRAWAKNDDGSYVEPGSTIEKPQVRYTGTDAIAAAVIVGWPSGLCTMDDDGNRQNRRVDVRIRQRPVGGDAWTDVATLSIVGAKTVPFWRYHRWALPGRGAWEIELTRLTDESRSTRDTDRTVWQALQSIRPEYPIAFDHPIALTAMRVKATEQLNGTIDDFSGIVSRIALDWDVATNTWIERETRSPAAALRWILQGPAAAYPVADGAIDLDRLADWSAWCATMGLHYDKVHDAEESLADALLSVAHGGRATPRHDGVKWGVVIDRPSELVVDHINPRNARNFKWTRTWTRKPDGFRVRFQDSTWDWKPSERLVPWPGHVGDIVVTEQIELPGKCDPDEIWIEARRRMFEIELRPDAFEVTQDGLARVATRGDVVAVSYDTLTRTQAAGRVVRTSDLVIELDEVIQRTGDVAYAIRFRVFDGPEDVVGASVVRPIVSFDGPSKLVRLADTGALPAVGDIVHVGPLASESLLCIVRGEERGEDGAVIYHLVAAAPEIDERTDAEVPPAWNGRAGSTYTGEGTSIIPAPPVIISVVSGRSGTGSADGLVVRLSPGEGSAAVVDRFAVDHRLVGGVSWTTLIVSASTGGTAIDGYVAADTVELRAAAISLHGATSAYGPIVTVTIGSADVTVPAVTAIGVGRPISGLRSFDVTTPPSISLSGWRLRARPGSGWSWADLEPLHAGTIGSLPWYAATPIAAGLWTIGAVAVADSAESVPFSATVTLAPLYDGLLVDRIESALSWPGSVVGGSIASTELVGSAPGTDLVYTTPTIDLGADVHVDVAAVGHAVIGDLVLGLRIGSSVDGAPTGAVIALGAVTARYLTIVATVGDVAASPRLGDLTSIVRSLA